MKRIGYIYEEELERQKALAAQSSDEEPGEEGDA